MGAPAAVSRLTPKAVAGVFVRVSDESKARIQQAKREAAASEVGRQDRFGRCFGGLRC